MPQKAKMPGLGCFNGSFGEPLIDLTPIFFGGHCRHNKRPSTDGYGFGSIIDVQIVIQE